MNGVPVVDLVPGDVVLLQAGEAVPADCRLVEAHEVTVNNAALTGESAPVARGAEAVDAAPLLQVHNCVFRGTDVLSGSARAVVFATGAATEFGRILKLTAAAPRQKTPLQLQVAAMARRVAGTALATGGLLFAIRLPAGEGLVPSFVFALGVMVALVPEGLPATLSVSLAIGVCRMARSRALVKKLLAVEALGSTTVVCTDKTGTLTQAEMTVARMWAGGRTHLVSGVGYAPVGEVEDGEVVRQLLLSAVRCSNARLLMPQGSERWRVLGDTTEGALLVAAAKAGVDPAADESVTPRTAEYPFDSDRKLMSTVTGTPDDGYEGHVKGAPHAVLARCSDTVWQGRSRPLDETARRTVDAADDELASQGLRVLAVARRTVSVPQPGREEAECRLTLLGLAGMFDPPRPEVSAAVTASRRAGIRIIMLTGDHPLTAEAVARRVGIVRHQDPVVVSGAELDALDEAGLDALLARRGEHLLCRVSPEHKTWVVEALQRRGDVVAVTGDGANDVSALKHADIGDGPPAPAPARSAVLTRGAAPHPVPRGHPGRRSVPVFFWHINATGMPYAHFTPEDPTYRKAITLVQAGIVVSQFFNALAVRTERESIVRAGLFSNPWLLAAGAFGIGLMAAISHLSPLQAVFHTAPLSAVDWAVLVALGALLLTADEARKAWLRRHAASERGGVS